MNKKYKLDTNNQINEFISEITFDGIEGSTYDTVIEMVGDNLFRISICFNVDDEAFIDD